jgi:hypothetical protein
MLWLAAMRAILAMMARRRALAAAYGNFINFYIYYNQINPIIDQLNLQFRNTFVIH